MGAQHTTTHTSLNGDVLVMHNRAELDGRVLGRAAGCHDAEGQPLELD
jgi:hypothetical protein